MGTLGGHLTNLSLERADLGFTPHGMATLLGFLLIRLHESFKFLVGIDRLL